MSEKRVKKKAISITIPLDAFKVIDELVLISRTNRSAVISALIPDMQMVQVEKQFVQRIKGMNTQMQTFRKQRTIARLKTVLCHRRLG